MIGDMTEMTTTKEILIGDIDKRALIEMIVEMIVEMTVAMTDMIKISSFLHQKRYQRIITEEVQIEDMMGQEMDQETGQDTHLVMKKDLLTMVTTKADL